MANIKDTKEELKRRIENAKSSIDYHQKIADDTDTYMIFRQRNMAKVVRYTAIYVELTLLLS